MFVISSQTHSPTSSALSVLQRLILPNYISEPLLPIGFQLNLLSERHLSFVGGEEEGREAESSMVSTSAR